MSTSGPPSGEHQALHLGVTQALRDAILGGILHPGERLVESTIAEQMGVSRGPVREAIAELEKQGLVTNMPRRGSYVVQWSRADIDEIYTLRMVLEGLAARLAAQRITPEQHAELRDVIERMKQPCPIEESVRLDMRFHELLCAAARHSRLQQVLTDMHAQVELCIAWTHPLREVWVGPKGTAREHEEILDAVHGGKADLAEQLMRQSLESGRSRLMQRLGDEQSALVVDQGHQSSPSEQRYEALRIGAYGIRPER